MSGSTYQEPTQLILPGYDQVDLGRIDALPEKLVSELPNGPPQTEFLFDS